VSATAQKGKRFSEEDYGKPIRTLSDLFKEWVLAGWKGVSSRGRHGSPCAEVDDGHYYSFFSNQCQGLGGSRYPSYGADRKGPGLKPIAQSPGGELRRAGSGRRRLQTAPSSVMLALLAIGLGLGRFLAPAIAARRSLWVLARISRGLSGISEIAYALHGRNWTQILGTIFFALPQFLWPVSPFSSIPGWPPSGLGGLFGIASNATA